MRSSSRSPRWIRAKAFVTTLILIASLSACQPDQQKRAIVIGVDGVHFDTLQALHTPNFDRLQFTKAYAGGIHHSQKEQVTSSGSGWTTLLTGVWADKHKIVTNTMFGQQASFATFLSKARLDQGSLRTAAILNWGIPYLLYFPFEIPLIKYFRHYPNNDAKVVSDTIQVITHDRADVLFVHIDNPDHEGHAHGFGAEYDASILLVDQQIGQILDAIEQRESTHPEEDWLVMTVTDHGREADTGFGHGGQTTSEKTVYIGINDVPLNEEFTTPTQRLPYDTFEGLYSYPAQTAVAVTVLNHLNVDTNSLKHLEGTPLVGPLGVRKLFAEYQSDSNRMELSWINSQDASNYTSITRNDTLIAEIQNDPSNQGIQSYIDNLNGVSGEVFDYVVTTNGISSYFRIKRE